MSGTRPIAPAINGDEHPSTRPADESGGNAEYAYRQIRSAIVEGRYRPGQRLIERTVAAEFGLSRTPVREALRRLESERLVRTERNRGAIVAEVSTADIVDLYELRAPLESLAARRAAVRAVVDDVAALDQAIMAFDDAMKSPAGADADQQVDAANGEFHNCLLRIANHERLTQLLAGAVDLPGVLPLGGLLSSAERVRANLFHRLIRDAVAAHEPDRAARLMGEHVFMARDTLLARLRGNEAHAGPER